MEKRALEEAQRHLSQHYEACGKEKEKKKKGQKDDCGGKLLLVWLDVELSLEAKEASLSTWKETPQNKQPKQDTRPQCTIFMCMCECMNIFV